MLLIQPALFASLVQSLGDLVVIMLVVGLALHGWQQGLFQAALGGLQVLGSFFAAIFLADQLASLLDLAGIEERYAFAVAFLIVLLGSIVAIRLAALSAMRGSEVRLPPLIDRIGGTLTGACAGYALAGTVLVAWSMAPAPTSLELKGARLGLDAGTPLLRAAGRSTSDEHLADRLVRSYETGDWEARKPAAEPTVSPQP